jgi:UDP-GlcNAc3NAcA epimerase
MKLAPVYAAFANCKTAKVTQTIINTGQHYDSEMSKDFIDELDLHVPDYNLNVHTKTQAEFVGKSMVEIDKVITRLDSNLIIVYGDTNSTLAGAMVAAKSNIPLAHVEAGLREFDLSIPEETNKRAIDAISNLLFAPSQVAVNQLKSEQAPGSMHFVGDVTFDLINQLQSAIDATYVTVKNNYNLEDKYILATCHRAINTDHIEKLESILSALHNCGHQVIFPVHPRTAKAITNNGLSDYLKSDNIISIGPLPYLETQALLKNCTKVVTDSGGLIKEAYFHKVPAIIVDTQTEWVETVQSGLHIITGPDSNKILSAIDNQSHIADPHHYYGEGNASHQIVEHCLNYLNRNFTT